MAPLVQNDTLQPVASIMNYNPNNDSFSQFYGTGVYSTNAEIFILVPTPMYVSTLPH